MEKEEIWSEEKIEKIVEYIREMDLNTFSQVLNNQIEQHRQNIEFYEILLKLQRELYWKVNDLDKVLSLSEQTLNYLNHHPDSSPRQKSAILYNIASFTCPWWSDSLQISPNQAKKGWKAAKDLVKLRLNNNFEPMKIAGAYWIWASHYLYTKQDFDLSIKYFTNSKKIAEENKSEKLSSLITGNSMEGIGRANILLNQDIQKGTSLINKAINLYNDSEDEYSIGEAEKFLENIE